MKRVKLIAFGEIIKATGRMTPTGRYDEDGTPILRAETFSIQPGTHFEATEEEARQLLDAGAALPPESGYDLVVKGEI